MSSPPVKLSVVGQCCPMPLIEIAKTVKSMMPGQVLHITGDDPIFEISVRDFCQALQLEILSVEKQGDTQISMLIRR